MGDTTGSKAVEVVEGAGFDLVPTRPAAPDQDPVQVYLAQLSPGSRRAQRGALDLAARLWTGGRCTADSLPWPAVGYQHVAALRAALVDRYAPATCNRVLAAVRGALRAGFELGRIPAAEYQRVLLVKPVRGRRLVAGRSVSRDESRALFQSCAQGGLLGARDAAMFALLLGAGLRRAEVAALDMNDYDVTSGTLRIRGKGDRERVGHATNGAAAALTAWVALRGPVAADAPLLCGVNRWGRITGRRLTSQAVYAAIAARAAAAGVSTLTPHDCRRTFVSDLLDAGADLAAVQQLAGHASPSTTSRYDRRGDRARRRAAELLTVPYVASTH